VIQEHSPVVASEQIMPGVHLLKVKSAALAAGAKPGQFAMIVCDGELGRLLRRPISICGVSAEEVTFLFAVVGSGTGWLARRQVGETVDLLGPLGNGFKLPSHPGRLFLIAGGMGIAPLLFLAQIASQNGHQVKLLIGAKTAGLICPFNLIPQNIETFIVTEDGTLGVKGLVTTFFPPYLYWAERVYTCGPVSMYRAMVDLYRKELNALPVQLSLEVRMGCGLGFCYACTIKTRQGLKQVCRDGPVFDLPDVLWDEID